MPWARKSRRGSSIDFTSNARCPKRASSSYAAKESARWSAVTANGDGSVKPARNPKLESSIGQLSIKL